MEIEISAISLTVTADDQFKTYDALLFPMGDYTVSYDGFITGEDKSDLDGTLAFSGPAIEAVNAGAYTITPEALPPTTMSLPSKMAR